MPRSWVIAGRFNESSPGSTPSTTNGIEVARTIMKSENVHLGCACASVVNAPPHSPVLTRCGDSASAFAGLPARHGATIVGKQVAPWRSALALGHGGGDEE